ncbi:hypothetical protein [Nitriliruptor alkaliphilus]|uniref:hypothetical protein n=1 Tax=Nitriliruptor alkaliphilus TaxID=427918 RepID=UPI000698AF70|nr:hypothetical protein [Nitriliruptor alkaliphilus]
MVEGAVLLRWLFDSGEFSTVNRDANVYTATYDHPALGELHCLLASGGHLVEHGHAVKLSCHDGNGAFAAEIDVADDGTVAGSFPPYDGLPTVLTGAPE